eukprot:TRINITY_DN3285_c0_g4_i3.p1 TRINITY_DN3285_c0_g4~~TRINITY_DN3285_c0_g4_i3.p1  ORF type:complete len:338 (-),score=51.24 TRINITY_DN3285_c0_g4_i3:284-1297(-)
MQALKLAPEGFKIYPFMEILKTELLQNNTQHIDYLIEQSLNMVTEKTMVYTKLQVSKIYEYQNKLDKANEIYESLQEQQLEDWKICMEYIYMLMRTHQLDKALEVTKQSLKSHPLIGRLWAQLIQILHIMEIQKVINNYQIANLDEAYKIFIQAIHQVPKSGEIWCEGARLCLNPFGSKYNIDQANKFIQFSIHFTPQYGDPLIEMLKLTILQNNFTELKKLKQKFITSISSYGHIWNFLRNSDQDNCKEIWKRAKQMITSQIYFKSYYYFIQSYAKKKSIISQQKIAQVNLNNIDFTAIDEYNENFFPNTKIKLEEKDPHMKWRLIFDIDQFQNLN